ncbi:helix-turn-helix domain-containing protein [Listeria costaricensis]|uniref:helix-turn-helix domain-containing protein n=1 Tax=Listeria costaricensis TaxID=2026604 RepID=UPI000C07F7A0|nr:Rgg/GadR/MutR family transcriptional regulator [Listeria costaricensis]
MKRQPKLTIGQTLKSIRENSHLTQKELYDGIMSVAHRHRIEVDEQTPSFEKLSNILSRVSISFDEFEYIKNGYQLKTANLFFSKFLTLRTTNYPEKMKLLKEEMEQYLQAEKNQFVQHLLWILEAFIYKQETKDLEGTRKLGLRVWESLEKKDAWYFLDIFLISQIVYIFDYQTIEHIMNRLFTYLDLYHDFQNTKQIAKYVYYNYATLLKEHGEITKMIAPLKKSLEIAQNEHDLLLMMDIKYLLAEIDWINGEKELSLKEATKIIQSLYYFGMKEIALDNKKEWLKLTNIDISLEES